MQIKFFCFWEINKIGVNIYDENENLVLDYDLSNQEAKDLLCELQNAIYEYELLEQSCHLEE